MLAWRHYGRWNERLGCPKQVGVCPTSRNVREAPANVEESILAQQPIEDCFAAASPLDGPIVAGIEREKSIVAHQKDTTLRHARVHPGGRTWLPSRVRSRVQCTSHVLHLATLDYRLTRAGMPYRHLGIAAAAFCDDEMVVNCNGSSVDYDVVAGFAENPTDDDPLWSARFGANDEISVVRGR